MNRSRSIRPFVRTTACAALAVAALSCTPAPRYPAGLMAADSVRAILDKTGEIRLEADRSGLSDAERRALDRLLAAGPIFQRLYERSMHDDALVAHDELIALDRRLGSPARTRDLLTLYRLFQGPIATTLENKQVAFLPVEPERPGRTFYPADADSALLAQYVARHPEALEVRNLVRRATAQQINADLAAVRGHAVIDSLHPGLRQRLEALQQSPPSDGFYLVPFAVGWADEVIAAREALLDAAGMLAGTDDAFAGYLRLRATDLITEDYTPGDSAWVAGGFRNLNAQIGTYETYGDALYGVKAQYGLSLLVRDRERSDALAAVTAGIQAIEDDLPYASQRRVRSNIPVGVYQIVADFGDPRGTNTATILPNEAQITRRFGRTILLRANIMNDSTLQAAAAARFASVVEPAQAGDLNAAGGFNRTVWHEIGHYLGPEFTRSGREIDAALTDAAPLLEEMKADLIALHAAPRLRRAGYYDDASLKAVYASGILRVLLRVRPRRDQPYGTMQLMQFNWFLEHGVLAYEPATKRLHIDYAKYPDAVRPLLAKVLELQHSGDRAAADAFIAKYTEWKPELHEALAERMRAVEKYRFWLVKYAALGE